MTEEQRQRMKRKVAREKARKKAIRRALLKRILFFIVFILLIVFVINVVKSCKEETVAKKNPEEILEESIKNKYFPEENIVSLPVEEYYVYGTQLNMKGSFDLDEERDVLEMSFFLTDQTGEEKEYGLAYEITSDNQKVVWNFSNFINSGMNLDMLDRGYYAGIIKVVYSDYMEQYYVLDNQTTYEEIEYYTITKNSENNRIQLRDTGLFFSFLVEEASLPANVYDIMLDPGHGGSDGGAVKNNTHESDLVMEYALDLKKELESLGLKVGLTRDGTESEDKDMVYNVYDEDGRVHLTCASGAKYCFSLHLNSNSAVIFQGGVEVFAPGNADYRLAKLLADRIVERAGTNYSGMSTYKQEQGVYVRNFTSQDIENMQAEEKYEPYSVTTDTPYLYMIRETGGIITGAIADGRNPAYGSNDFRLSNKGVETYVLEMGYLSVEEDYQNIKNNSEGYVKGIFEAVKEFLKI